MDEKNLYRVFGWPDSSWLRGWKDIDSNLKKDREGMRARKRLCESVLEVIEHSKGEAILRLNNNDFEIAHAYTNELLEMAKMIRETCDANLPRTRRRDVPRAAPKPISPAPTPTKETKKKRKSG